MTRQLLMRLEQDGDIGSNQVKKFYKGVQLFYTALWIMPLKIYP